MTKVKSNDFWINPNITNKQKMCLMTFQTGQYMGHARKQLFFIEETYPLKTCPICNTTNAYTWLHLLRKCKQHMHALITK
jgi:hypothetical protein